MSQFVVNLNEPPGGQGTGNRDIRQSFGASEAPAPKKRGGCLRLLKIGALALVVAALLSALGGYLYWRHLKTQPQYSLALLVEASRNGEQKMIDELVDTDAVVDSFIPQIADKAVELYGRNLPPAALAKVTQAVAPLVPAIKRRAREEVPRVIEEKTGRFASVPYWAIALGAGRFMDVRIEGEQAIVTSRIPERPFELAMRRNGDKWRVVGIKDEALARRIAQTVGQELIAVSTREGLKKASERLGVPDLQNIQKKIDDIFK